MGEFGSFYNALGTSRLLMTNYTRWNGVVFVILLLNVAYETNPIRMDIKR